MRPSLKYVLILMHCSEMACKVINLYNGSVIQRISICQKIALRNVFNLRALDESEELQMS
jgi:hypothetical protein